MANLNAAKPRTYRGDIDGNSTAQPIKASNTVWQGSAVQEGSDGGMENATGAGTTFAGIAMESGVATATIGQAPRIKVCKRGDFLLPVTIAAAGTVAYGNLGTTVYCTDGDTFTTDATGAQAIGRIVEVPDAAIGLNTGFVWVRIVGVAERDI